MKAVKMTSIVFCVAVVGFIVSCSKSNSPVASQTSPTTQSYFESVVNGNNATSSALMTSDASALNDGAMIYSIPMGSQAVTPSIQSVAVDSGIMPLAWGRDVTGVTRAITSIAYEGDSVANVMVQIVFTGNFMIKGILVGTNDTIMIKKPYTEMLHRSLRFIRTVHTDGDMAVMDKDHGKGDSNGNGNGDDHGNNGKGHENDNDTNWVLDAVSVVNGGTANSSVAITGIQVITPMDTLNVTDPDNYFMEINWRWMRFRLPLWGFRMQVTVNVSEHSMSADTDIATLHYVESAFGLHRKPMTLVSSVADPAGGYDRMYTMTMDLPENGMKFSHVFASVTTHASLYSASTSDFASSLWGIPYKTSQ